MSEQRNVDEPFGLKFFCAIVVIAAIAALIGMTTLAGAHDNGQYSAVDLKTKACIQALRTGAAPSGCCNDADGHPVEAEDWRPTNDGHFQVKITNDGRSAWYDVPANAELKPAVCGLKYAVVWWYPKQDEKTKKIQPVIRCFEAGTEF